MVKPIHLEELALRVNKLLMRRPSSALMLVLGRVTIHCDHRQVTFDGDHVHLTPTQYVILEQLAQNVGFLVTKEHLLEQCWERHTRGSMATRCTPTSPGSGRSSLGLRRPYRLEVGYRLQVVGSSGAR